MQSAAVVANPGCDVGVKPVKKTAQAACVGADVSLTLKLMLEEKVLALVVR